MKTRQVLIIICTIILLIIIYLISSMSYMSGVEYGEKNAEIIRANRMKSTNDTIIPKYVNTKIVINKTLPFTLTGHGRVMAAKNINISTEVQGELIAKVLLKKGTEFNKGQVLFKIKDNDAQLTLIARKSNYLNLISNCLPDLKIDFSNEFIKWENFFNKIKVNIPLPDLPDLKTSREKNFIVSRSILSEYYSIKSDEERLKKYTIIAPFKGSILESYTDEGSVINPGSPVINIIRSGEMEIEIPINPLHINKIKIGSKVDLNQNNQFYEGNVVRLGEFVNPNTQNLSVFVQLKSKEKLLFNGMYLEAKIQCNGIENVTEIPRKAIFGNNMIYLVNKDSLLIPHKIDIKSTHSKTVSVKGIKDHSVVVIEPIINAKDSMKVWPLN